MEIEHEWRPGFRWIDERGQGSADGVPRRLRATFRGTFSFVDVCACVCVCVCVRVHVCVLNPEGMHRRPIAGNITMLPHASGLSNLQRKLARELVHLSGKLPGTQQLRRLMGHCQFGARVEYGDCLFLTVSPNEQLRQEMPELQDPLLLRRTTRAFRKQAQVFS